MSEIADRLVKAAYAALEPSIIYDGLDPTPEAREAAVAVLRVLSDLDCTWDDVRLEALANEIEGEPVMNNPPGFDEGFKRFQEEWPKRFTPEDPAHGDLITPWWKRWFRR